MKQIKLNYFSIALALTVVLASCHKDKIVPKIPTSPIQRVGLYILNQGGFGDDNSTLTYYNYASKQLIPDFYAAANGGAQLGDTGNDIGIYGSKMYIVVNNSNVIDVVNAKTGVLIKQVALHQCRSVVFNANHAFITSYDNEVAVMDTTTLTINSYVYIGRNPEQMVIANNKLYVANSGGLSFGNPDTTVSVINMQTLTEEKRITVTADPVSLTADANGKVCVLSLGNFSNIAAGMTVIDDEADTVVSKPAVSLGFNIPIASLGSQVYFPTADNKIAVYSSISKKIIQTNFITDGTVIQTPYAITTDPTSGEVFITDAVDYASNGKLDAFDSTGKLEYSLTVGINPGRVIFINK
jgi:hypothetical protein